MITGVKRKQTTDYNHPETTYRQLRGLNQSSIALFDENPMQFYSEFILGNKREQKSSYSFDIGDLADFYLLTCHGDENEFNQRLDECFVIMEGQKSSAQAFTLADILFNITIRDTNEDGMVTTEFSQRFIEAFEISQSKGKYKNKTWEKGLEDFEKTAKDYFDTKLANVGKTVVDLYQIDKAKKLVEQLRTDEFLSDFINQESDEDVEVLKKVAIQFDYRGFECKGEIDFMHINHKEKKIYLRDLKTAYDNESFEYSYIKYYYYLQSAFYYLAAKSFAIEHGLLDYSVEPMQFLVLDTSKNNRRPLLYCLSNQHVIDGIKGFTFRDSHYRGIDSLIDAISWANSTGIWTINKENYDNKGIVQMKEYK